MIHAVRHLWRLGRVGATLERTGAMPAVLGAFEAPTRLRLVIRLFTRPVAFLGHKGEASLPPAARALQALGPAYVKFGQVLSTRPDVTGKELARELRVLQDKLPPFSDAEARATVERELGRPVDALFAEFGPAVAAASIAQVHPAIVRGTGRKVAVKVLRPEIEREFRKDVDAFYFAARVIEFFVPFSRRLRPTAVIEHFDGVVTMEMDLRLEASAASEYRANSADDPNIDAPEVLWPLSARRVMTTEWVAGTPMGDVDALKAKGFDLPALACGMIQTFLRHALRDGFFHADMHQGNLKVAEDGAIVALDFGIMGRIDALTRRYYAEILYGFLKRDYKRVAEVHFEAGYVPADKNVDEFAQALRAVGEPIFGQDASHISMGRVLAYLFEVTERFGMQTRTELILLQRTMVVVEGVARSLDPNSNMWSAAQPVVEEWIRDNLGPAAVARDLKQAMIALARLSPRLPDLAEQLLIRMAEDAAPREAKRESRAPRGWLALALAAVIGAAAAVLISGAL